MLAIPSGPSLRISPALGWNTSTPLTLTWIWRVWVPLSWSGRISMSGSPKITNRLPLPVSRSPAMCRSAFTRALRMGMRAGLAELGGVRVVAVPIEASNCVKRRLIEVCAPGTALFIRILRFSYNLLTLYNRRRSQEVDKPANGQEWFITSVHANGDTACTEEHRSVDSSSVPYE